MIDYSEEWLVSLLFQTKGSVALRASQWAVPCAFLAFILVCVDEWSPTFREEAGLLELGNSQLWAASTGILSMLLSFRTNRAMARFWEGTGLLHQMRGEWFDSISCCVTFSIGAMATQRKEVFKFRHTIVRLMSLCHGSALEEIAGGTETVATIDSLGLDNATLMHLKNCKEVYEFNRVEVLLHLTQSIITHSLDIGILRIPPPILSRVYQTLSRGFVNLLNAKKIADTRFPFPYAQMIAILLFIHLILTPVMLSCLIKSKIWAPIFTFVPVFATFSVNYVGVELENPFGTDDNDLPLAHFQGEMNKCLMMLLHESADHIAGVSDSRCITDFDEIQDSMADSMQSGPYDSPSEESYRKSVSDFAKYVDIFADTVTPPPGSRGSTVGRGSAMDKQTSNASGFGKAFSRSGTESSGVMKRVQSEPIWVKEDRIAKEKETQRLANGGAPRLQPPTQNGTKTENKAGAASTTHKGVGDAMMADYSTSLPGLRSLVETQVTELSRSIAALSEFSDALPAALDSMLLTAAGGTGPSRWRKAMLKSAAASDSIPSSPGVSAIPDVEPPDTGPTSPTAPPRQILPFGSLVLPDHQRAELSS